MNVLLKSAIVPMLVYLGSSMTNAAVSHVQEHCEIFLLGNEERLGSVDEEHTIRLDSNGARIGVIVLDHFYHWPKNANDLFAAYRHNNGMIIDNQQRFIGYVDQYGMVYTWDDEVVAQVKHCNLSKAEFRTDANALAYFTVLAPLYDRD